MSEDQQPHRLTSIQTRFLSCEKPSEPLHVGGCGLYAGSISRDEVVQLLTDRLHLLPRYRQKVVFPPLGLAHPTWEDAPDFDIHSHIEEITLPAPGDDRILAKYGGQVFASLLNRDQPLWKLILLHGRSDGRTAIIAKVHYAMVDGLSGIDLMTVLHDLKPGVHPAVKPPPPWQPRPIPDSLTQLQEALRDRVTETVQWATDESFRFLRSLQDGAQIRERIGATLSAFSTLLTPAPRTPFNEPLSSQRQFVWAEFSFPQVRAIRSMFGGTVNDVVLAVIAGGIRRHLQAGGYKTDGTVLRVACPVMLRRRAAPGVHVDHTSSRLSALCVPLYIGITDPASRLAAQRRAMEELKVQEQAKIFADMSAFCSWFPPIWQSLTSQLPVPNTLVNTVALNIPGPQIPLYLAGHRRLAFYPLGPLAANMGLSHAIASYNQKLTIGVTLDPQLISDPWCYVECLQESFAELREAAERVAARSSDEPKRHQAA